MEITRKTVLKDAMKTASGHDIIARLLYPSYYFDDLKNVLENNEDESCLLKYINKTNEYEKFLKSCLKEFSLHSNIIKIDWLL